MKKDDYKTTVIFRKWKPSVIASTDPDNIIALFPYEDGGQGYCSSYQRVGQHGGADYHHCISTSTRATPEEYLSLQKELESRGYNLDIKLKRTWRTR